MTTATKLITQVCDELNLKHSFVDGDQVFLCIHFSKKDYFIINNKLGLVNDVDAFIAKDKAYQYQLLYKHLSMPLTKLYVDPDSDYADCAQFKNIKNIVQNITDSFSFPLIIKRNTGSMGDHVFRCQTKKEVQQTISKIFDQRNKSYDHVLLAQENIDIDKEYRVIVYKEKVVFLYEKDISNAKFIGNLSPLHWENSKSIIVSDEKVKARIEQFVKKMFKVWPISYAGLDIVKDKQGKFCLIEVNAAPTFAEFCKHSNPNYIKDLYRLVLSDLAQKWK